MKLSIVLQHDLLCRVDRYTHKMGKSCPELLKFIPVVSLQQSVLCTVVRLLATPEEQQYFAQHAWTTCAESFVDTIKQFWSSWQHRRSDRLVVADFIEDAAGLQPYLEVLGEL